MSEIPARFKQALQQSEERRDASIVAELFREGAKLTNLGGDHGNDATRFWQIYLEQFSEVHSEFLGEIASQKSAALEWTSRGKLTDGRPVDYRGVSLIEFDDEGVTSFRTYSVSCTFVETAGRVAYVEALL